MHVFFALKRLANLVFLAIIHIINVFYAIIKIYHYGNLFVRFCGHSENTTIFEEDENGKIIFKFY